MRRSSSSSTGFGDLMVMVSFLALSVVAGAFVTAILMVMAWPVVAVFPVDSGAREIVTVLALLWGVIAGCAVAVLTLGPWRRLQAHGRVERFDDSEALPLEMVGRPVGTRRRVANDAYANDEAANDRRPRRAVRARYQADDDEDDRDTELMLEEEAEAPRRSRRPAPQRHRRVS